MKLAIIGAGRIAQAIVAGLIRSRTWPAEEIVGTTRTEASGKAFLEIDSNLSWSPTIEEAVRDADVVFLSVKPSQMVGIFPQLKQNENFPLYISVAAGILISTMEVGLGAQARIIRAMPNTPAHIQEGVTGFSANQHATTDDIATAFRIFNSTGHAFQVPEKAIDAVTALSGSGPAYFYQFIDALSVGAIECGLDEATARQMAIYTAIGAARMLEKGDKTPHELMEQIRTPGGTTEAALRVFQAANLTATCKEAIHAATARSQELSKG